MRPLQLDIAGLNSFRRPASIRFEPLLKDGLFGIFGPTGSGKSTILDAITLALYGKVRRAPGGTQGIINMAEDRCSVSFTFAIGTNGGRRSYTVDRLLVKNKGGGIETKKVRLVEHRDGTPVPIGEKKHELKEKINDIIGISVEDFLRAVVLPQGAFAEFLTLETRERSAVLQRLFGLYDLGDRLSSLLKERAQALEIARAETGVRLQQLGVYDDDALRASELAVQEAEKHHASVREEYEKIRKKYDDAAALHALISEYRGLEEDGKNHRALEDRLALLRSRIELAERAALAAPAIAAFESARDRFEEIDRRYAAAVKESDAMQESLAAARSAYEKAKERYVSRYDAICDELAELARIREGREELAAKSARLRVVDDELLRLNELHDAATRRRSDAAGAMEALENEIAAIELEMRKGVPAEERSLLTELKAVVAQQRVMHEETERTRRELADSVAAIASLGDDLGVGRREEEMKQRELDELRNDLATARRTLDAARAEREHLLNEHAKLKDPLNEIERYLAEIEKGEGKLRSLSAQADGTRKMIGESRLRLMEARSLETSVRTERGKVAALREEAYRRLALASLAEHLQDGVPCPLCGSIDHADPFSPGHSAVGELEAHDAELDRLEKKLREAEERTRHVERNFVTAETGLESAELAIEEVQGELASAREKIAHLLRSIDEENPIADVEALREQIQGISTRGQAARRTLEETEPSIRTIEERIRAIESERNGTAERRAKIEAELAAKDRHRGELELKLDEQGERYRREADEFHRRAGGRTIEAVEDALRDIERHDHVVEDLRRTLERKRGEAQEAKSTLERADAEQRAVEKSRGEIEGERRTFEADIRKGTAETAERFERVVPEVERATPLERLIVLREEERDMIRRRHDETKGRYDEAMMGAHVARERVDTCWNDRCREEKERDEADRACAALLAEHGFETIAVAREGMLSADELRTRRTEAQEIVDGLDRARHRMIELREKIGGRTMSGDELALLRREMERAKQEDEEVIRALGAAQEKLRECSEKNAEWKKAMREDLVGAEERATAEQLAKYLRGNGFIDFLAHERLAEICRRASMGLDTLTTGRFAIEARQKEGFIIRDNGNGGGERSPASLSGGETFLVSLALALALSDTIQLGRAPLEFFFLDEGFGTLDNDLLDTVMNTLERLRSDHRAIGVISHVTQLRERINRRLIVTPAGELEGSTVRFEVA